MLSALNRIAAATPATTLGWPLLLVVTYLIPSAQHGPFIYFALHAGTLVAAVISLRRFSREAIAVASLGLVMTALTALALAVDAQNVVARDLLELPKYALVSLALLYGYAAAESDPEFTDKLYNALSLLAVACLLFWVLQSLQLDAFVDAYVRDKLVYEGKPVAFFWSTYFAAAVYSLIASLLIGALHTGYRTGAHVHALILGMLGLILLTQSRSAFFALLVLGCAYLAYHVRARPRLTAACAAVVVALAAACFILGIDFGLGNRLRYLLDGLSSYLLHFQTSLGGFNSLTVRLDQLSWAIANNDLVLVGRGIGKGYNHSLESWPAYYYYRFGLSGMLLYILLWGTPIVMTWRMIARNDCDPSARAVVLGLGLFAACLAFLSLSNAITDQPHLLALCYVCLGAAFAHWRMAQSTASPGGKTIRPQL